MTIACVSFAQKPVTKKANIKSEGKNFVESTSKKSSEPVSTGYTITIKGVEYPIYKGSKGSLYIIRTSKKTGKEYKSYLDREKYADIYKTIVS